MRSASGAACATPSSPGSVTDDIICAMPNSPQARTISAPAPAWKHSSEPTGASITGIRSLRPNRSTDASTRLTSVRMRGRNAMASSAMRLRRSVVSVSAAPTM